MNYGIKRTQRKTRKFLAGAARQFRNENPGYHRSEVRRIVKRRLGLYATVSKMKGLKGAKISHKFSRSPW